MKLHPRAKSDASSVRHVADAASFSIVEMTLTMTFSLRTLLVIMLVFGALPFWYQHFLVPFFLILAICIGMSVYAFGEGSRNEKE